jgi:hypothetical protein
VSGREKNFRLQSTQIKGRLVMNPAIWIGQIRLIEKRIRLMPRTARS